MRANDSSLYVCERLLCVCKRIGQEKNMPDEMRVRLAYLLLVDGWVIHPDGDISIAQTDWDKHKAYHVGIGGNFIDCNATGGEPEIAKQMLSSKGIQWRAYSAD
jgi:hypothetical protein